MIKDIYIIWYIRDGIERIDSIWENELTARVYFSEIPKEDDVSVILRNYVMNTGSPRDYFKEHP